MRHRRYLGGVHIIGAHCCNHNRQHVRIELHDNGIAHRIVPKTLNLVQVLPDFQRYRIHIRRLRKLQDYHGIIFTGYGLNALNIAHRCHRRFHRFRNHHLHRLRTCPRISGHHNHIRQTDIGQQVGGHPGKRHHSQNNRQHHRHQHRIWLFNTKL